MRILEHMTRPAQRLSVGLCPRSTKEAWHDMIEFKLCGASAPFAGLSTPRLTLGGTPFSLSNAPLSDSLREMWLEVQELWVRIACAPQRGRSIGNFTEAFLRVAVALRVLIAQGFPAPSLSNLLDGFRGMRAPEKRVIGTCDVSAWHDSPFVQNSENRVNSVEHSGVECTSFNPMSQYRAKHRTAYGPDEGVTARRVSANNNPAQERPTRKRRYSLTCLVTGRSADKKPHDNSVTTPQDGITAAFFDWAQLSVSIAISRKEERQNSGKSKILSLLESKIMQAESSGKELLNNCITAGRITASANLGRFLPRIGRMDSGATGPQPITALVDANPSRSAAIGNINPNTYSFWRNQASSSTATTFAGWKAEMNNVYNNCSKGVMGNPDVLIGDQTAWETYWNLMAVQERYVIDDKKTLDILGGSEALKFRGATFIWDEIVPDVETNAELVDAIGSPTTSNVHFLNTSTFEWVEDAQTGFITTPFVRPENQDAKVAQVLWMGALGINNRRKNGVLYGISRAIIS